MKTENVDMENSDKEKQEKHHLFENDQYEQVLINAIWYNKTMPKKRRGADYGLNTRSRRGAYGAQAELEKEGYLINLESIKTQLLEIESIYSSTLGNVQREWDT